MTVDEEARVSNQRRVFVGGGLFCLVGAGWIARDNAELLGMNKWLALLVVFGVSLAVFSVILRLIAHRPWNRPFSGGPKKLWSIPLALPLLVLAYLGMKALPLGAAAIVLSAMAGGILAAAVGPREAL